MNPYYSNINGNRLESPYNKLEKNMQAKRIVTELVPYIICMMLIMKYTLSLH